ncbi:MAG: Smr/MutS family protein [Candidatus Cloacimonetes bacterium]|nr:Smr/MutS family protein [Candidatus Cloacimonadota bacterium]
MIAAQTQKNQSRYSRFCIPREFDGIEFFDKLDSYRSFDTSEKLLRNERLSFNEEKIVLKQNEVEEMILLLDSWRSKIGCRSDLELQKKLNRNERLLEQHELATLALDCMDFVEFQSFTKKYLRLNSLRSEVSIKELCDRFVKTFDMDLNLLDSASEDLFVIRRSLRDEKLNIRTKLEQFLTKKEWSTYLQEDFYIELNGRYVLLIKTDFKGRMDGIVHGVSKSGQTTYFEPKELVALNQNYLTLLTDERKEVFRIIDSLVFALYENKNDILDILKHLRKLDIIKAKALFSQEYQGVNVEFSSDKSMLIKDLFHPLIEDCVKNDVHLDSNQRLVILSGPNSGGKTATLKSVGLCFYFAALGLRAPARSCILPKIDRVLFLMGDYQSLLDSLSSFSAHLHRFGHLLKRATENSFLLIDEIMTATDPREGEALALMMLRYLGEMKIRGFVSTHFSALKKLALQEDYFVNASMIFNKDSLQPTYILTIGTPGNSYGIELARKFGMPQMVIEGAQKILGDEHFEYHDLIETQKIEIVKAKKHNQNLEKLQGKVKDLKFAGEKVLQDFENKREKILAKAYKNVLKDLRKFQKKCDTVYGLTPEKTVESDKAEIGNKKELYLEILEKEKSFKTKLARNLQKTSLQKGDTVKIIGYNKVATVLELYEDKEELRVSLGSVEMTLSLDDVESSNSKVPQAKGGFSFNASLDFEEADLRGLNIEDATMKLDGFIDRAKASGLKEIRIIHGKGVVKTATLEYLSRNAMTYGQKPKFINEGSLSIKLNLD